jgi:hypothetical protein
MLTTGVVGDVVGLGLPAIISSWPYLTESLGAAGLVYDDYEHLVRLLDSLTEDDLAPARRASRALQDELAWDHIAVQFLAAVIDAGAIKSSVLGWWHDGRPHRSPTQLHLKRDFVLELRQKVTAEDPRCCTWRAPSSRKVWRWPEPTSWCRARLTSCTSWC